MTKYILHGGNVWGSADGGKAYFEEIVKDLGSAPRLLLCFFAKRREEWEETFARVQAAITQALPEKQVTFSMAMPTDYAQQAEVADALIIHGGDDELLIYRAKDTAGFVESLKTLKVIAGSSAGADMLVENFWPCDWRQPWKGLGVLSKSIIVHYGSDFGADDPRGPVDWEQGKAELQTVIDSELPILTLAEGQFETFVQ